MKFATLWCLYPMIFGVAKTPLTISAKSSAEKLEAFSDEIGKYFAFGFENKFARAEI